MILKCKFLFSIFIITYVFSVLSLSAENLPKNLADWAHKNPIVTVGVDSTFPPFDYVNDQGKPAGIAEMVRKRLSKILPLSFQVISQTDFEKEYRSLLKGDIDTISICENTESRQNEVLFSSPLLQLAPTINYQ
jgi:hypothetical protein